jgi:hypothetical protein
VTSNIHSLHDLNRPEAKRFRVKLANLNIPKIDLVEVFVDLLEAENLKSKASLMNTLPLWFVGHPGAMNFPRVFRGQVTTAILSALFRQRQILERFTPPFSSPSTPSSGLSSDPARPRNTPFGLFSAGSQGGVVLRSQSSLRPPPLSVTSLVNRLTILLTLARSTPNISH